MIELKQNCLEFSFADVHPGARLKVDFQRTLRIPDDGTSYPLPPGLGRFPLRHVDDFGETAPEAWNEHGGVMLPMYQSEALWVNFDSDRVHGHRTSYPFAVKIATGKINAVTGDTWKEGLSEQPQDYLVVPEQPWLDGYCVETGTIRQFVAMPLGAGYTTEEQISEHSDVGGLQVEVFPMKREVFEKRFPAQPEISDEFEICYSKSSSYELHACEVDMGLAPGGRMRQKVYDDPYSFSDWDLTKCSRCFVHICNSLMWRAVTSDNPPTTPLTSKEYSKSGLPWYEYYDGDKAALSGSTTLDKVESVAAMGKKKGDVPLPENKSVHLDNIQVIKAPIKKNQVREGSF